jgi:hypothetical protein
MATETLRKDLVFPKGGHYKLEKYGADGKIDPTAVYISPGNIVKTVSKAHTVNTSPLPDGNSTYAAHEYVTTTEDVYTIEQSTYDPDLEAFLNGCAKTTSTDASVISVPFETTVPETAPYTIELPHNVADENFTLVVKDRFGNVFAANEIAAAGGYSVAVTAGKATLTFVEADRGTELFMVYDASIPNVTSISYPEKLKLTSFRCTIMGEATSYNESQNIMTNNIIDKVTVSSFSPPAQSNDPTQGWSFAIKTGKPRAGVAPVINKFVPIA